MLSGIPDGWGPKFNFDGGAVTRTHTGPNEIHFTASVYMVLILFTAQPQRELALNSDKKTVGLAPVGAIEVVPAQSELFARWTVEKQNLLVAVDSARLERLAGLEFDRESFELQPPKLGFIDEKAHAIARWMQLEVENGDLSSAESLDALITLFAAHLLRNYSSLKDRSSHSFNGGLPPGAWRRVNEFIQENLSEHLSLERLASIAHLSPSHFARAFKQTTGQPPHQYVISSRLARARDLVIGTDVPLSQIAKSAGFSSNSHMTSMMRRAWRTTPTEFRRRPQD